jgi:biopolymer transport protein ExbD
MMASANSAKTFSDINITPLTDIFLVLLIIMMVVAPSLNQQDQTIKLPNIQQGEGVEPSLLTISITANNTFYVQGKPVPNNELHEAISQQASQLNSKKIVVKADKALQAGAILTVLKAAANTGVTQLAIAGTPTNTKGNN